MAKKNTIIIVGIVVAVLIVAGIGWITVGSDLVDSISGGGGGGSNQNTTQEDTNKPPTAILEAEPTFVREGEAVVFDGNESYDIDYTGTQSNNGIFFFEWNFGDGSEVLRVQNGTEKSYIYNEQGVYIAKLTVFDEDGLSDTDNITITVVPQDTFISTGGTILIGQALIPGVGVIPNSTEVNWSVKEDAKVMNLTVTVSGYYFQEMRSCKVEAVLFNPYEDVLANETFEITGQKSVNWYFDEDDIDIDGEYYIYAQCYEGAARISVEGQVSYVE